MLCGLWPPSELWFYSSGHVSPQLSVVSFTFVSTKKLKTIHSFHFYYDFFFFFNNLYFCNSHNFTATQSNCESVWNVALTCEFIRVQLGCVCVVFRGLLWKKKESSNWDWLCCNIFRVCHRVQTLTQTLCPFRNGARQASSGGSINRSPGYQERTHVCTLTGFFSNLRHVILCLPQRRSVRWFAAHKRRLTNGCC